MANICLRHPRNHERPSSDRHSFSAPTLRPHPFEPHQQLESSAGEYWGLRFAYDFSRIPVHAESLRGGLPVLADVDEGKPPESQSSSETAAQSPSATEDTSPKLTKKQLDWVDLGCGSFKHDIRWELDKPTTKGGIIVQKVEWSYDVKKCDGTPFDMTTLEWYKPYKGPYWEAWEIKKNQKVTTFAQKGVPMDDQFSAPSPGMTTKGSVLAKGTPDYYDGMKIPADFKATGRPPAGALPMSWNDPQLSGGSGTIPHSFGMDWKCCK